MTPEKRHRIEMIADIAKRAMSGDDRAKESLIARAADVLWLAGLAAQDVGAVAQGASDELQKLKSALEESEKNHSAKSAMLDELADHMGVPTHQAILPELRHRHGLPLEHDYEVSEGEHEIFGEEEADYYGDPDVPF